MSFLAPLWLAGLLALVVPLALHLLGRGRPPRVELGSVRLLTAGAVRVPRRARLQRPLLLLVRCLVLAALALALAGPRLRALPERGPAPRPWVLVEPGLAGDAQTWSAAGEVMRRSGPGGARAGGEAAATGARGASAEPELRWLAPGLPALTSPGDGAALPDPAAVPGGAWSLLAEAATAAPAGSPLTVVTSGRLAALRGERPALDREVRWEVVADPHPNRWLAGVAAAGEAGGAPPPRAAFAVVGSSDRAATRFSRLPIESPGDPGSAGAAGGTAAPGPAPGEPAARENGAPAREAAADGPASAASSPPVATPEGGLRLPGSDRVSADGSLPSSAAPAASVRVAGAPDRQADLRYVVAAVRASAAQAGVALRLEVDPAQARPGAAAPPPPARDAEGAAARPQAPRDSASAAAPPPPARDPEGTAAPTPSPALAFWLADTPPPPDLLAAARAGATLVLDAAAAEERCAELLRLPALPPVAWHRCATPAAVGGAVPADPAGAERAVWRGAGGRPLLTESRLGDGRVLRLAGRFHPGWSELVLSPAFPEWLADLLAAATPAASAETPMSDRRGDGGQGAPARWRHADPQAAEPLPETPPPPASPAPESALWVLLPALVVVERWLAGRAS